MVDLFLEDPHFHIFSPFDVVLQVRLVHDVLPDGFLRDLEQQAIEVVGSGRTRLVLGFESLLVAEVRADRQSLDLRSVVAYHTRQFLGDTVVQQQLVVFRLGRWLSFVFHQQLWVSYQTVLLFHP